MSNPSAKLYVFDVDGPIYDGYLLIDFARFLVEQNCFRRTAYNRLMEKLKEYKTGKLPYATAALWAVQLFGEGIAGQKVEPILDLAETFVRENRGKFFPKSIELLRRLKKQGKKIALLSLSSLELITAMKKTFNIPFDYYQGSWFKSRNGTYTGESNNKDIHEFKRGSLVRLGKRFKVPKSRMRMVGDSPGDYRSAKAVRIRFVGMNPDRELRSLFRKTRKTGGRPIITRPKIKK